MAETQVMSKTKENTPQTLVQQGYEGLEWMHKPTVEKGGDDCEDPAQGQLLVSPGKGDYWQKTYYTPRHVADDGAALLKHLPVDLVPSWHAQVEFNISRNPGAQFDQAGLMVRFGPECWIKTGIEYVDDKPKMSCVVTNGFSDWSTQPWHSSSARMRLSQMGDGGAYVVEAQPTESNKDDRSAWHFIRICQLQPSLFSRNPKEEEREETEAAEKAALLPSPKAGIFTCCPTEQKGCTVTFRDFTIRSGVDFDHKI